MQPTTATGTTPPQAPAIQRGTVKTIPAGKNFGFVRPDGAKIDLFFHFSDNREVTLRDGVPTFGHRSNADPKAGDVIYFVVGEDARDRRPKATQWGHADGRTGTLPRPAHVPPPLESVETLMSRKAEGLPGAVMLLNVLLSGMSEWRFRAFCDATKEAGEALWLRFKASGFEEPLAFADEVLRKSLPEFLGPRSCQLPVMFRLPVFQTVMSRHPNMSQHDMLAFHYEEPEAMRRFKRDMCGGCNKTACAHYMKRSFR